MNARPDPPHAPRPRHSGPFFDYVRDATRDLAGRERVRLARLALRESRFAEDRQRSAEQRWEGEGGRTGEALNAGRRRAWEGCA